MNNLGLIQARLNSSRLKNKMLKKFLDKEILYWVIKRTLKSKFLSKVVVLIPENDIKLIKVIKQFNVEVLLGNENNVLERFALANNKFKFKNAIRICADNPFIDSEYIDFLIKKFNSKKFDYAYNHFNVFKDSHPNGFGCEIFTKKTLENIIKNAKSKKQKEHVTKYIWDNKNKFRIQFIEPYKGLNYPFLKFDVDTKSDYSNLQKFILSKQININTSANEIIKKFFSYSFSSLLKDLYGIPRTLASV